MTKHAFIFAGVLFLLPQITSGQTTQPQFTVDSAVVSYKVKNNNLTPLVVGEKLILQDSINVRTEDNFHGYLRLHSTEGREYNIISPKGPCSLKYALSGKMASNFKKCLDGFQRGLLNPVEVVVAALGHLWGNYNNTTDGLSVVFLCNKQSFSSFLSLPVETPFSLCLTNTSSSILEYSIVFQYRTADTTPYKSIIIDTQEDSTPILLVPGESVVLPLDFIRPQGYLDYSLNIFGGTDFFLLQIDSISSKTVHVVSNINNVCVNRFYFETNE